MPCIGYSQAQFKHSFYICDHNHTMYMHYSTVSGVVSWGFQRPNVGYRHSKKLHSYSAIKDFMLILPVALHVATQTILQTFR